MKNLIIFLCLFYSHLMSAQILFSIDEMEVHNVYIRDCKDYIEEGSEEGPAISMKFTLKNNCDSTIKLTPANSTMWLSFRFKNRRYKTDIFALGFLDNEMIEISPNAVQQVNHYYPFEGLFGEGVQDLNQRYRYNGKELDRELGLDMYDYGARHYDDALGRWFTVDPLAEKYYSTSPYVYVANNPVRFIDLRGDSLTLVGDRIQETLLALYNGLEKGTAITMNFNNGVLDPTSIEYQAKNTNDVFLQDIYEIAINPTMVELSTSNKNTYIMNGQELEDKFNAPYDFDTKIDPHTEGILKMMGEPIGYSIHGNLGQTLIPGKVSASGKSSKSSNVEVIINGKGSIRQRTVGLAHEFGHVILYFRGLLYGHRQPGVDDFVYGRATMMSKRLGYDF